jgi:hypothetical protein
MMKTGLLERHGFIRQPGLAGGIEQGKRSDNIGLDKFCGAVNGAVDMRFRGKVDNRVHFVLGQDAVNQFAVTDIPLDEKVAIRIWQVPQILQIRGIGKDIQIDNERLWFDTLKIMNEIRADEAGAPCD